MAKKKSVKSQLFCSVEMRTDLLPQEIKNYSYKLCLNLLMQDKAQDLKKKLESLPNNYYTAESDTESTI